MPLKLWVFPQDPTGHTQKNNSQGHPVQKNKVQDIADGFFEHPGEDNEQVGNKRGAPSHKNEGVAVIQLNFDCSCEVLCWFKQGLDFPQLVCSQKSYWKVEDLNRIEDRQDDGEVAWVGWVAFDVSGQDVG